MSKELVDKEVIPGHVVPDRMMFTEPMFKMERETATFVAQDAPSNVKVTVSLNKTGADCKDLKYLLCTHLFLVLKSAFFLQTR